MKRLFRAIFFYTIALYVTSLIIPGFKVVSDIRGLLLSGFTLALCFAFVGPLFKFLLLPINFLTLGLLSFLSQVLTFTVYLWWFPNVVKITSWYFQGAQIDILGLAIGAFWVGKVLTVVLSTIIISCIVSALSIFI